MRKFSLLTLALLFLTAWTSSAFGQANNGSVGGQVQDASKALIPGVTITITNVDTGVVDTRLTNESGIFNFPSVPPGTYKLTGDLTGFRQAANPEVKVGTAAQVRVDLVMQVGAAGDVVTVAAADVPLTVHETTASVGEVLEADRIRTLPLVTGNVLDLLTILPGFRQSGAGDPFNTVGGLGLDTVNTTINGMTSNSSRNSAEVYGYQVFSPIVMSPDLVGEIRLILAPVDAELGRGNSQVQIQTRSGTNKYSGSAAWNVQNSGLNANTWVNNHTNTISPVNGSIESNSTKPNWKNINQFTVSYGGPIIKNKTFFFALYDKLVNSSRTTVATNVLTDTARQGIFRYYAGFNPQNSSGVPVFSTAATSTAAYPAVDALGNPTPPPFDPTSNTLPYTGQGLMCFSIYGDTLFDGSPVTPAVMAASCPGGTFVQHATWDQYRPGPDSTGYIAKVLNMMPHANDWSTRTGGGDGLNTANYRFLRGSKKTVAGTNSAYSVSGSNYAPGGSGDYNNRWQANIKIDHNINSKNRVSVSYNFQTDAAAGILADWPNGFNGNTKRLVNVITVNGTSTINANLVNEARFGVNYTQQWTNPPWANPEDPESAKAAKEFSLLDGGVNPTNGKVYPVAYAPSAPGQGFRSFGNNDVANTNPLWDYADTIRWTHGRHSFSFGGEYRRPLTAGFSSLSQAQPVPNMAGGAITGGPTTMTPLMSSINNYTTELPGFLQTARGNAVNLNYLMYGSVATGAAMNFWVNGYEDLKNGLWQDLTTTQDRTVTSFDYGHQERRQISNEWSFFAKDDFKVTKRLTLNLGIRFDENMSPYLLGGLTNRLADDGVGLYGAGRPQSGDLLSNWFVPGSMYLGGYGTNPQNGTSPGAPLRCDLGSQQNPLLPISTCDPSKLSTTIFIGPGSANPNLTLRPQKGRFSPAIGFAYQLPWFGEGKTSIRGGFQRTYGGAGGSIVGAGLGGDSSTVTLTATDTYSNAVMQGLLGSPARALNLTDVANLIPRLPTRGPGQANLPIAKQSQAVNTAMYAPDYVLPYTDNFTLSVTRNVSRKVTLDVRFVNTLGKKQNGTIDLNQKNWLHNPDLLRALDVTRAGGDDPFFDQLLMGINLIPSTTSANYGPVGTTNAAGVLQRGSAQIRRLYAAQLATGNYNTLINGDPFAFPAVTALMATAVPTAACVVAANGGYNACGGQALPFDPSTNATYSGAAYRLLRNGCDRIANNLTTGITLPTGVVAPKCLPEDFLLANPQFSTANLTVNYGRSNYASGQMQFTVRPVQGVTIQGTYSISKTMQQPASGYTDPLNRTLDYGASINNVGQEFRANGTVELPIGPNKLVMGNSSGWVARAVEKWQTSFTMTLPEGVGRNMTGNNMMYANGRPDVVGPWDDPKGHVSWESGNAGQYFADGTTYLTFPDFQCGEAQYVQQVADANGFSIKNSCSLVGLGKLVPAGTPNAVIRSDGRSVLPLLANPKPGHQGTLGKGTMRTVSRWSLNASASKNFRISESKSLQVRIDTSNVLNHPTVTDPTGLDGFGSSLTDSFGRITSKSGSRTFSGQLRFSF